MCMQINSYSAKIGVHQMKLKGGKLQAKKVLLELEARLLEHLARGYCGSRKLVKSVGNGSALKSHLKVKLTGQMRF